jgi:L-proline amide hydrolase
VPAAIEEMKRLRSELPSDVRAALDHHETNGSTDSDENKDACEVFYRRHLCRLSEWPPEMVASFDRIDRDPTVYGTMNGPSEFSIIGTIRELNYTDQLESIDNPVHIVSGANDEITPKSVSYKHMTQPTTP